MITTETEETGPTIHVVEELASTRFASTSITKASALLHRTLRKTTASNRNAHGVVDGDKWLNVEEIHYEASLTRHTRRSILASFRRSMSIAFCAL
jgi:hypothetical protein